MAKVVGTSGDDTLNGTNFADEIQGLGGDDVITSGDGNDVIYGDSRIGSLNPDAVLYAPTSGVFSYSTGSRLGNGVAGGSNHRADVGSAQVSNLEFILPTGDLTLNAGETISFSFTDENGDTVFVESAVIQQTAFARAGANETGVLTAQGVDQDGRQVAILLKLNENNGAPPTPIRAGDRFYDNDINPNAFNGRDIELPPGSVQPLSGLDGNDVIDAGNGDDQVFGGGGNDTIEGGAGNDRIDGGTGDDDIVGGEGQDQMSGGDDADRFTISSAADGNGDRIDGGTGGNDVDVLDLTGAGPLRFVNLTTDADGDSQSGRVEFLDADGNVTGRLEFSEIEQIIPCFTSGTMIATPAGEKPVETLREGDKVITRDNGMQEIRWIGKKQIGGHALDTAVHLRPVLVRAGALGHGLPERDLLLSPNHRVLLMNEQVGMLFDEHEVLSSAKHLCDRDGIDIVHASSVTYWHILFDNHEVILSNGAWSESFQPGNYSLKGVGHTQRQEIFELFPDLSDPSGQAAYGPARMILKAYEAKLLRN